MSASPITGASFPVYNPSADLCSKLGQLFGVSAKLQQWFEWAFDESGNWNEDAISQIVEASVPIGTIVLWSSASLPSSKWLVCNGNEIDRTTYSSLYGRIGTTFGAGNSTSTFNLPNLVGKFPIGAGTEPLASTGGERTVKLTGPQMADHTHIIQMARYDQGNLGVGGNTKVYGPDQAAFVNADITTDATDAEAEGHNNMPPFLATHYIIRAL